MVSEWHTLLMWDLGRFLLGGLFVWNGVRHLFVFSLMARVIAARGVPAAKLTLLTGTLFQIAAGLSVMAGVAVYMAALGLAAFTLAASAVVLNFWDMKDVARYHAIQAWQSHIAIVGGLLVTAAHAG